MGKIDRPDLLIGKYVQLRDIEVSDAQFILDLRLSEKAKFLHSTSPDLQKQIDYLKRYKTLDNEWYFIIENKAGKPIGAIRIYDVKGTTFTHGSWLMIDGLSVGEAIEGEILGKKYAFEVLEMTKLHFDVRKENKKVIAYHKMWNPVQVDETDLDCIFELSKAEFEKQLVKFEKIMEY